MGFKPLLTVAVAAVAALLPWAADAAPELQLNVSAYTSGAIESDWTAVYYSESDPLLISNDGGTANGGFHTWPLDGDSPLVASTSTFAGRTKLLATVYNVDDDDDYFVSISQTTSILSAYRLPKAEKADAEFKALGDWSALCTWRSQSGNNYIYLFGKTEGYQILLRERDDDLEFVEVQKFPVPMEFAGCAVSAVNSQLFLTPDDGDELYAFNLTESTKAPELSVLGKAADKLTGVAVYTAKGNEKDYIFAALESVVAVYEYPWTLVGTLEMAGLEKIEIEGLSMYQAATSKYPAGALAYGAEAKDFNGFALSSLEGVLRELGIEANPEYDPRSQIGCRKHNPIDDKCSKLGFASSEGTCDYFAGATGDKCDEITCEDNCSGHGTCAGPNQCECEAGWGGLHCSFLLVEPKYETTANGVDGDDPAIWISPQSRDQSRIVTTTKSETGAGLGVFDLTGKLLQIQPAAQPNNVDIIYGFQLGNRTIDLAYAACRADNTLCMFEMTADGRLQEVPGGIQPSNAEDEVYGSCVYRSKKTGKQYLFVNEKSARYMQYELTATSNGTLQTTLVRDFVGGSGGQVEGCVSDEDNGWLILGEEPSALWRYDAEPDGSNEGYRVAFVGDGRLFGDVEGVTLVQGSTKDEGYIIVSGQGVSAYNVYQRAHPHEYVLTYTITDSADGQIDHVTNTDSLAAVGVNLGPEFPKGLVVVHDDSNELPEGGASDEASYKLVALDSILAAKGVEGLNLLDQVDPDWDPRVGFPGAA